MATAEGREASPRVAALVVASYLVLFRYWSQLVYGPHAFVWMRLLFAAAAVPALTLGAGLPLRAAIGSLGVPGRSRPRLFAGALLLAVALRLALKVGYRHFTGGLDTQALGWAALLDEAVLPALNEEVVFRGLILSTLLPTFRGREWQAVLVSTAVFAASHSAHDPLQQIATSVLGMLLGFYFARSRSLSGCMAIHAAWNGLRFLRLPPL